MSEHNLSVLRGTVVNEPTVRDLASGTIVVSFDVTTRDTAGAQSVPVAWFDPPGAAPAAGAEVVVVGSVRRRFFRAGGATQSRTEVVADRVVDARRRRDVTRALAIARAVLEVSRSQSKVARRVDGAGLRPAPNHAGDRPAEPARSPKQGLRPKASAPAPPPPRRPAT